MKRGAWWATVHRVTKNQTRLSNLTFTFKRAFHVGNPTMIAVTPMCYGKNNPGLGIKAGVSPSSIHHCELLGMSVGHSVPQFLHL